MSTPRYAELQVTTHFSFLRGASSCEELFEQAKNLGIEALGIVDRNSLAGIPRAYEAANNHGVGLVIGCRLDLDDDISVLAYPMDRQAYGRLCRVLSVGKKRGGKGKCRLTWDDLVTYGEGLIVVLLADLADDLCALRLRRLKAAFFDRAYMALSLRRRPNDQMRLFELSNMALAAGVPTVVTNDVLFHVPERRMLQDVVTCIRHNCTIDEAGFRRERHADRYMKPPEEMHRLFARYPEALSRSLEIAKRCKFSLKELVYQYPEERSLPGLTAQQALEKMVWEAAPGRYPDGLPDKVEKALHHELGLIGRLEYAPYFLTVNAIVRHARSLDILCQGRGSAANSVVCYVLGITAIDPVKVDLLFERFVSEERREPPDIDVDFEHQRREEVIQWVYDTYGRDKAALCSVVTRYRGRGALRDVGKVLGLPEDLTKLLSSQVWRWSEGVDEKQLKELNLNMEDRRLKLAFELANQLVGTPRHHSQHPGGFVLTHDRLDELVPIEPAAMDKRQIIEWDKDDVDIMRFMKMDCLALGMLSCMKRGFNMLEERTGYKYDLATVPQDDDPTYEMIQKADTLGTFQIESRAQMSMLPRLKPKIFYDLVIQVAIVRPGPIQGDMVHPYLRRRDGKEKEHYPKEELRGVLGKTLGVPLFQEQAMRVAIECAGFSPGKADQLRRAMATFKNVGTISKFRQDLIDGMVERGYEKEFAERIFKQLEGFGSYGFPESHAASFALIAYASSWLKCHYPDIFCTALLNSQPMGFYAPAQIVRDARDHGVEVRPVCVNNSRFDCTLEPTGKRDVNGKERYAVRLGMRLVKGLANKHAADIVAARQDRPFASVDDLWRRAGVPTAALVCLAEADAFLPSLSLARREALWAIKALRDEPLPLFAAAAIRENAVIEELQEPSVALRPMTDGGEVVQDYGHVGLTLREHPMTFLRRDLSRRRIVTCAEAARVRDGTWLETAGLVLVRQRPGSAKGVIFMTLEDETGIANAVLWVKTFEKYRRVVLSAGMVGIYGKIQREGEVVHLVAHRLTDLSQALASVGERNRAFPLPHGRGDEFHHGTPPEDHRAFRKRPQPVLENDDTVERIKVISRNFH
ncbi:error-prone DNA polymerase [Agrobacterium salinitolerans]|uniref:Error-prone DNA polymerase n=1 Tax=Agrobacterium salinitolerans TaxID=1183413 RepID=A0A9X3KP41_9HYPH|nr:MULTISPECIES: error-prone DNA polymerase [Agrobacterium]MCZ7852504.1 error-prone DNA polymerase [Agrobacterium salinitolerans]MCZ7892967.1 error-prone DNA polymerase [Agrobacterium salinitolerans]MCZ7938357.1 error-prone DNA polymerase [Agrobacterium salinitolerans]MCZ7976084.1 error-prone DNA polymerase [Agrobacterium salinitolerans]TRA95396.1 DNA polymerase III subunit alpha [Agrobacterium salinitolerans]